MQTSRQQIKPFPPFRQGQKPALKAKGTSGGLPIAKAIFQELKKLGKPILIIIANNVPKKYIKTLGVEFFSIAAPEPRK
jgi:hypothetical protein